MFRKSFNLKVLAVLVGAVVLVAGGFHLVHARQMKRVAVGLLTRAEVADKEGRDDVAEQHLKRYLALRPDDVDGLVRYASLLAKRPETPENRARVIAVDEKIVRFDPSQNDVRRKLVDLLMEQHQFSEAKVHLAQLADAAPKDGHWKYLQGRCEEETGQLRDAAALYQRARELKPSEVEAYGRLADLLRRNASGAERADQLMDARQENGGLIASNPKSATAYLARARYRVRYGVPGADADILKALALAPDDPEVRTAAATMSTRKGDLKGARAHLMRLLELRPDRASTYQALSALEQGERKPDAAISWLRRGVEAIPAAKKGERAGLRWYLARLLIESRKLDDAEKEITSLREEDVRKGLLDFLEAEALFARGRWADAARALAKVQPVLAAAAETKGLAKQALVLLGRCYEQLGNADQRLDAYRRAVAINVDGDDQWVPARLGLASSLVALDKIDEALDEYRLVLTRDPGVGFMIARLQLLKTMRKAQVERSWGEVDRTIDAIEKELAGRPESTPGMKEARAGLTLLRAEAVTARGDVNAARALLESALAKDQDQPDLWVALANVAGRSGRPEATLEVLDDARKRLGNRVELRAARVGYWARKGGEAAPAALAEVARDLDSFDADDRDVLWRALASAYTRLGKNDEAKAYWDKLAAARPDDLVVRLALFDAAVRANDERGAAEGLEEIRRIEGEDGSLWRFGRALRLVRKVRSKPDDKTPLEEARTLLEKVAALRPTWSRAALALAEVDELAGRPDGAIRHYLKAIDGMGERDPEVIRRTAQLLTDRQRYAEAEAVVAELADNRAPLSGDMQRLSAEIAFRNQEYGHALEQAEKAVPEHTTNPRDLLWLGRLRQAAGRPAEPLFRRALELDRKSPEAWLALALYLSGSGRRLEAEKALAEAERVLPPDASRVALAQGYEAAGRADRAGELYAKALAAGPKDVATLRAVALFHVRGNRTAEAEAALQKIIDLDAATTDAAWARRTLAAIVSSGQGFQNSKKALAILGLSDDDGSTPKDGEAPSPDDLRLKATILANQPSRARRKEATTILEALIERRLARPNDVFLLARLEDDEGDWPQARVRLQQVTARPDANPNHTTYFINALIRHRAVDEAKVYLDKLEKAVPPGPSTVVLRARLLNASGKAGEAVALLTDLARKTPALTPAVALQLDALGQPREAEQLLTRALKGPPKKEERAGLVFTLTDILARHSRGADAIDVLDKEGWPFLPAAAVSSAAVKVLYASTGDSSALYERVAKRVDGAIRANPKDNLGMRFDLANLRSSEGRYEEAEAIFRAIYEENKANAAPLNNLAWMMALRGADGASQALPLIEKAIQLEGELPDLLDTRAVVYLALNRTDPAIRDLEDAIAARPTPDKYFHLARAYLTAGRTADSQRAFREAKTRGLRSDTLYPAEKKAFERLQDEFAER